MQLETNNPINSSTDVEADIQITAYTEQSPNFAQQIVLDLFKDFAVDALGLATPLIGAWIIYFLKTQIAPALSSLTSRSNTPFFTTKQEEELKSILKDFTEIGFNRATLFFLDNVKRHNNALSAKTFSTWLEACSGCKKRQFSDSQNVYSYVSSEINTLLENKKDYVFYWDRSNGKICQVWLEDRKTSAYGLYLIDTKYTGFVLLERTKFSSKCVQKINQAETLGAKMKTIVMLSSH